MATHTHRKVWTGAPPRIVAGLISGTSADGIASVLVKIAERRGVTDIRQLAYVNVPYPDGLQAHILSNSLPGTGSVDTITRLNAAVGDCFAHAVFAVARKAHVPISKIDLIGSHGQTVHHLPNPERLFGVELRSTLQIGDPSVIAQRTGVPTVGDFRAADIAQGGQGAPLVPYLDFKVFRSNTESRLLLNLGGIANFTVLPKKCSVNDVMACDTGPANMVIDALAQRFYNEPFDRQGSHASAGTVNSALLTWMMSHPYIKQSPPKSTGREFFGGMFVDELMRRSESVRPEDVLSTATEFTALSVYYHYVRFFRHTKPVDVVLVSGGGSHNTNLMQRLKSQFGSIPVRSVKPPGFSADAKEAVLFALLARETVLGRTTNLPRVTGATNPVILGKICLP